MSQIEEIFKNPNVSREFNVAFQSLAVREIGVFRPFIFNVII